MSGPAGTTPPVSVAVVVPTYRRADALQQCLAGLARQQDPPDEVVVVHRAEDDPAVEVVRRSLVPAVPCLVSEPGVVAAMAAGSAQASSSVVAFCDDDAIPHADWTRRIRDAFTVDPWLGGLGGRDVLLPPHPNYPPAEQVGTVSGWGRMAGDHHRGAGRPREVGVLKAVNMAFRREALAFPTSLRGSGAQVHFEVPMCRWARGRGWKIVFDPALLVDHDPRQRFDADGRDRPDRSAISDAAFNYTLGLLSFDRGLRARRPLYGISVGDRASPGAARAAVALARRDTETARRLIPSIGGQLAAVRALRRGDRVVMEPVIGYPRARPQ